MKFPKHLRGKCKSVNVEQVDWSMIKISMHACDTVGIPRIVFNLVHLRFYAVRPLGSWQSETLGQISM